MPADIGSQTVTIKYRDDVDDNVVNNRFVDVRTPGIYEGGYITITDGALGTVSVSALSCEIRDATQQVKVTTEDAVSVTLTEANPYLVLRWERTPAVSDYMELLAASTPSTYDLVVGKGLFTAGVLTSIVYTERTHPNVHSLFLKVVPTIPASTSVRVKPGVVHIASGRVVIVDQSISLASYSASDVVYVYVTDTGGISHSATISDYAGKVLLARIVIPATTISESDIEDIRTFLTPPAIPDETTITRSTTTGKLKTVDPSYGTYQNDNVQASGVSSYTKLVYDNYVNDGGGDIAESSGVITLAAGKLYKISYLIKFEKLTLTPDVEARLRVLSGDTGWNLNADTNNVSHTKSTMAEQTSSFVVLTNGVDIILPSSITTLQLEALTRDSYSQTAKVISCKLQIWAP